MVASSSITWSCGSRGERSILRLLVRVISIYTLANRLLGRIRLSFHWEFPPVRLTVGVNSECLFTIYLISLCNCFAIDILLATLGSGNYSSSPVFILWVAACSTIRLNYGSNIGKCICIVQLRGHSIGCNLAQMARIFEVLLVIRNWLLSWWFLLLGLWWSYRCGCVWCLKIHCIVALTKHVLYAALLQCSITCFNILWTERLLSSYFHCVDIQMALCFMHLKSGCCSLRVLHINLVDITLQMVDIDNLSMCNWCIIVLLMKLVIILTRNAWISLFSVFWRNSDQLWNTQAFR